MVREYQTEERDGFEMASQGLAAAQPPPERPYSITGKTLYRQCNLAKAPPIKGDLALATGFKSWLNRLIDLADLTV